MECLDTEFGKNNVFVFRKEALKFVPHVNEKRSSVFNVKHRSLSGLKRNECWRVHRKSASESYLLSYRGLMAAISHAFGCICIYRLKLLTLPSVGYMRTWSSVRTEGGQTSDPQSCGGSAVITEFSGISLFKGDFSTKPAKILFESLFIYFFAATCLGHKLLFDNHGCGKITELSLCIYLWFV